MDQACLQGILTDASYYSMFWFEEIPNRKMVGFEYLPISWREYPRGCVEFGPYRTFMVRRIYAFSRVPS